MVARCALNIPCVVGQLLLGRVGSAHRGAVRGLVPDAGAHGRRTPFGHCNKQTHNQVSTRQLCQLMSSILLPKLLYKVELKLFGRAKMRQII